MKHLLLLHGAIGAKDQLASLSAKLEKDYQVHSLNFNGHGGEIPSSDTFSISSFATDVLNYLQQNNIQQAAIFGYSMGGYVAMYLARHYPQTVTAICTLGTKFYWDESVASKETRMLNPTVIGEKVPAFAEQLQKRHGVSAWKEVLKKTKELLIQLGKNNILQLEDYHKISIPCLLLLGDKDKMVTEQETTDVEHALPNAEYRLLPDTAHPIEQVDTERLAGTIRDFFK